LDHETLSVARQCALLGLPRSTFYYTPVGESPENLALMAAIDRLYTELPYYGSPRMTAALRRQGHAVNHKRVERLPYLLRDLHVERPNQVWCSDITYVGLRTGSCT
jgi:putative transposase